MTEGDIEKLCERMLAGESPLAGQFAIAYALLQISEQIKDHAAESRNISNSLDRLSEISSALQDMSSAITMSAS